MRFTDFKSLDKAIHDKYAETKRAMADELHALHKNCDRVYEISDYMKVVFSSWFTGPKGDSPYITVETPYGSPVQLGELSVDEFAKLGAIRETINDWIAGNIDSLPPSGFWFGD